MTRRGTVALRRAAVGVLLVVGVVSFGLPGLSADRFVDVGSSHLFATEIAWLAGAGITRGCNPPANTRFCPDDPVTRGQMAAFIRRAINLPDSTATFDDTVGHTFEGDISRLAGAGITRGCNPPANNRYCPDDPVTRGQMAAFVFRALADPQVTTTSLPQLGVLESYSATLQAIGGTPPYTWTVTGLPSGVVVAPATGVISNHPVDPAVVPGGETSVAVRVTDSNGRTDQRTIALTIDGAIQVSTGGHHSCAVTDSGAAYCWGNNDSGQVGDGATTSSRLLPSRVRNPNNTGNLTQVNQISAGWAHSCAVTDSGAAYCWGNNGFGRLGDGTTTQRELPVRVRNPNDTGNLTQVNQVSAGSNHSCGVTDSGAAYCWGNNSSGQVGDGTTDSPRELPVHVRNPDDTGNLTQVTQTSAGSSHSCAVTVPGAAYCWGNNETGKLGDGTTTQRELPVQVRNPDDTGNLTQVTQTSAVNGHSCAVTVPGAAYCWGWNTVGHLGDGTTSQRELPTPVHPSAQ